MLVMGANPIFSMGFLGKRTALTSIKDLSSRIFAWCELKLISAGLKLSPFKSAYIFIDFASGFGFQAKTI